MTRDLGIATERFSQYIPIEIQADLTLFTEFATTRRYEESDMILERGDREAAIDVAAAVLAWVQSHAI